MANLTSKELTGIEEQLNAESMLIKKNKTYAKMCSDPEIRSKCEQIAAKHQNHYNSLLQLLK